MLSCWNKIQVKVIVPQIALQKFHNHTLSDIIITRNEQLFGDQKPSIDFVNAKLYWYLLQFSGSGGMDCMEQGSQLLLYEVKIKQMLF